jgi:hypothetical protein
MTDHPASASPAAQESERVDAAACQWIAVSEKLPPRHTNVWCLNADGHQFEGCICVGMHAPFFTYPRGDGCPSNTAPSWINVTHWMPLPPPPSVGTPSRPELESDDNKSLVDLLAAVKDIAVRALAASHKQPTEAEYATLFDAVDAIRSAREAGKA